MKCRIDKSKCKIFLRFGRMPIANGFLKKNQFKKEYFFELNVGFNKKLSLFQLEKNPSPKIMPSRWSLVIFIFPLIVCSLLRRVKSLYIQILFNYSNKSLNNRRYQLLIYSYRLRTSHTDHGQPSNLVSLAYNRALSSIIQHKPSYQLCF